MRTEGRGLLFSELSKFEVKDSENNIIGRVGDLLLDKSDLNVNSLILYGSKLEEKLEALHLRDDVDPIIPINIINRDLIKSAKIQTTITKDKIDTTYTGWKPPDDLLQFSKLKKTNVVDKNDKIIGRIVDMIFHSKEGYTFVIGGSKFIEFLHRFNLNHNHDLLIPQKYFTKCDYKQISISVDKTELTIADKLPISSIVMKEPPSFEFPFAEIRSRYHYLVFEVDMEMLNQKLKEKEEKISMIKSEITINEFNTDDEAIVEEFTDLFNEVAMTSVDPYEELTPELAKTHFSKGTFIAYRYGKPVGYCITSEEETNNGKIGAIAGIGIHHKQRGKKLSLVILSNVVKWFEKQGNFVKIQADILDKNEASLGLFTGLGFEQVKSFYL